MVSKEILRKQSAVAVERLTQVDNSVATAVTPELNHLIAVCEHAMNVASQCGYHKATVMLTCLDIKHLDALKEYFKDYSPTSQSAIYNRTELILSWE